MFLHTIPNLAGRLAGVIRKLTLQTAVQRFVVSFVHLCCANYCAPAIAPVRVRADTAVGFMPIPHLPRIIGFWDDGLDEKTSDGHCALF